MKLKMKMLIVEDEPKILEVLTAYFKAEGFQVFSSMSGMKALELYHQHNFDFVLLDLMLPDLSGQEVCRAIRAQANTPILMLTARVEEDMVLEGLQSGADDYVTKPFRLKEVGARVQAILRRTHEKQSASSRKSFQQGDLILDYEKNEVWKTSELIRLTPNEFKILVSLVAASGNVLTREQLIEYALNDDFDGFDRAIDSHIKNVRQKIETDMKQPIYIQTVHGRGYKFGGCEDEA